MIGADPAGSVYSGGSGRPYLVEGVGEDFWPETYDRTVADRVIEVSDADSFAFTRRLAREEAMLVGGSSGMAAFAAAQLARELAGRRRVRTRSSSYCCRTGSRLPDQGLQRRLARAVRLPKRPAAHRPDGRRGAARQDRRAAGPRAHASQRDHRRGGRDPPGVRRLPDARGPRGAADRGGRGGRLGVRPRAPRRALRRPCPAHRLGGHTWSAPLPTVGSTEDVKDAVAMLESADARARAGGRQAGRCADPAGPVDLPRPG